MRQKFLPSQRF